MNKTSQNEAGAIQAMLPILPRERRIPPPRTRQRLMMRTMVAFGLTAMGGFLIWFFQPEHIGQPILYTLLTIAMMLKLLRILHEWYHYVGIAAPTPPPVTRQWTADILTTFVPGEPYDMLEETLTAMQAVTYPHESYLCDEGPDPIIKEMCERLGVHHVYRGPDKTDAKAGNINYCLRTEAKGEIVVILDPDHVPEPDFLDRVLPYFEQADIGFVQSIQAYGNQDQSFIAKAAAQQTYHFYGPFQMAMHRYGTAQAIGANCTFRRAALDSIGGHAPGLAEDMHTSMQLHAKGWKSVYVPERLTRGRVPANRQAYSQQQLKWSRGTFELLFNVYPRLFRKFTWAQRIHYGMLPMHYLSGIVSSIDLFIPILCLLSFQVPWRMEILELLLAFLPVYLLTMLIRQFAQRWVLEEPERGYHVLGGILRHGNWWVYNIGLIFTVFRIRVPYIPTPKENEITNAWDWSLPNILLIILSIVAVVYGLNKDWSPYSWIMAGFAITNIAILSVVVLISQQKFLAGIYEKLYRGSWSDMRQRYHDFRHEWVYPISRKGYTLMAGVILIGMFPLVVKFARAPKDTEDLEPPPFRDPVAYWTGSFQGPLSQASPVKLPNASDTWQLAGFELTDADWEYLPALADSLASIQEAGFVPYVHWQPHADSGKAVLTAICDGDFDQKLLEIGRYFGALQGQLILHLDVDAEGMNFEDYRMAWTYYVKGLQSIGASNLSFMWSPPSLEEPYLYFPGIDADLVALHLDASEEDGDFIAQVNSRYREISFVDKPIMILAKGWQEGIAEDWNQVLETGWNREPYISGLLADDSRAIASLGDWVLEAAAPLRGFSLPDLPVQSHPDAGKISRITGEAGNYQLLVNGEPFYVKGMAYNLGSGWRRGNTPLTRRKLVSDFHHIKDMGANTIRRYGYSIYDRNLLMVAKEEDLKVIYGFWQNHDRDYYEDLDWVELRKRTILARVRKLKDEPSIIAWNIGNETWGLAKDYYAHPYLGLVRQAYLQMIEELAIEIKRIDPSRIVMVSEEHSTQLSGALMAFNKQVPSIDVMGVNSYYDNRTRRLDFQIDEYYDQKPYLVSEFGPDGYWDPFLSDFVEKGRVVEPSDMKKARQMVHMWEKRVLAYKGKNIGGVAFCWQERLEGTATWFGVLDFRGDLKPSFYALKSTWTGEEPFLPLADAVIVYPQVYPMEWNRSRMVSVLSPNNNREDLSYEWYICREEMFEHVGILEPKDGGRRLKFWLPEKASDYRVYVHIRDKYGHVVTHSIPLSKEYTAAYK